VSLAGATRLGWRVLRHEGPRAFLARLLDRRADARRRRAHAPAPLTWRPPGAVPVLNLLGTPPSLRLGGVPIQLLARLAAEERGRPVALLAPFGPGWRLEVSFAGQRRAFTLEGSPPDPVALDDPTFARVVRESMELVGARLLHVEGLAGLPLASLLALRRVLPRLVVSLHDFAAFCPRPHLLEEPDRVFCHYCRDLDRCGRCLAVDWRVDGPWQAARRSVAGSLLATTDALVFPSEFLRRTYRELFPSLAAAPAKQLVVPPSPFVGTGPPRREWVRERPRRSPLHFGYVGSVKPHKGATVFVEVVERLAGESAAGALPPLRWTVFGGGDVDLLARLRRLPGVDVRGYYRAGSLPGLLGQAKVDLALLLSTWPETHALTLDECRAAGVPALAFDHGALGDRLREDGGILVPPASGAEGVAAALRELVTGARPVPASTFHGEATGGGGAAAAASALGALYDSFLGAAPAR
jgi:glycosyltransferase involved in cell wall biosynthesis